MVSKEDLEAMGIIGNELKNLTPDNENNKIIRHKLYELFCNEIKGALKSPLTAAFCKEEELIITQQENIYYISGWVDSQNSYGAMIRTTINKFKVKDENGLLIPKSNARVMAGNKIMGTLAVYWLYGIIATILSFFVFYFIISASM